MVACVVLVMRPAPQDRRSRGRVRTRAMVGAYVFRPEHDHGWDVSGDRAVVCAGVRAMTTTNTPTPRAAHMAGPWREPYVDQLPNGLRAVRIDSPHETGVNVIALLPIGDGSDL